ncbi:hypothetical protein K8I31_11055, partial [bacterium]|nr:hypothetical protein [bacterium]
LLEKIGAQTSQALKSELTNLRSSLELLSDRLVPAPAHRGPSAARMVYPSQRRSIPAADLPTFHPLFCTSVDTGEGPVRLSGLSMDSSYLCKFRSVADPNWMNEAHVTAGSNGGFRLDLSSALSGAPDGAVVWMIEEDTLDGSDSAWISGLIWRSESISHSEHDEFVDAEAIDWPWRRIKTLTEINRLYSCGMYVEAYETARCALRTERATPNDGSMVPFAEALWLMIEQCLDSMISQLEAAQPVFQTMKSDWDAIQPLRRIRQDISL